MGSAIGHSPYNHLVNPPHSPASPPWDHPAPGPSGLALEMNSMSPNNTAAPPHSGAGLPNNGMDYPVDAASGGASLSHSIPTGQAPSAAGIPAPVDFLTEQHDRIRRHLQARRSRVQSGQTQQGRGIRRRRRKFEENGSHGHGLNQPGANARRTNPLPAVSYPAERQEHVDIDAITAEFLRTADPRAVEYEPGDVVDQVSAESALTRPQTGQAASRVRTGSPDSQELEEET